MNINQKRLINFSLNNMILGIMIIAFIILYQEFILNGAYHKIISFYGLNIPIGVISTIILSALFTFNIFGLLLIDYKVYKYGLEIIEIKEKSKDVKP